MPFSIVQMTIMIVVVAAVCALVFLALNQFGISIPGWVQSAFWIVVVACVIIFAIRLVAGM